ncbi:MAG: hypothetical protein OXL33_00965, partial [Chloroflexota bacterium]|nr:hypothetical protein [Chloroflexota bacterium]
LGATVGSGVVGSRSHPLSDIAAAQIKARTSVRDRDPVTTGRPIHNVESLIPTDNNLAARRYPGGNRF